MARTPKAKFEITAEDRTRAAFDRAEAGFQRVAKAGLALAGLGAGLGALAVRSTNTADALAKSARAAGFTGERFQELMFVGSQLGIQQEGMTSNLERFTKRIGEAANGTGAAAKMYEQLGIDVVDATGRVRDSDDVLRDVATAMQGLETDAERSAAAAALFGREGVKLGAALQGGPGVIDDLSRTARELGIVLDEDLLRNAEAASDQLDRMQKIASTQATVLGAELFPMVIGVGNAFAAAVPHLRDFFDLMDPESELRAFGQVAELDERIQHLREVLSKGGAALADDAERVAAGPGGFLGTTVKGLKDSIDRDALEAELNEALDERDRIIAEVQERRKAKRIDEEGLAGSKLGTEGGGGGGDEDAIAREQEKTERLLEAQNDRFQRLREARLTAEDRDLELENERFELQLEKLAEEREILLENEYVTEERKAELRDQFRQAEEDAHAQHTARLNEISSREAQQRIRIDEQRARRQQQLERETSAAVLASLQGLFGQSKAFKLAMLAFEKGKAIADVLTLTEVASMRAIAELGPIAGPPAAAAIRARGALSVGIIAAQGIAEAASAGSSGGGGGGLGGGSFGGSGQSGGLDSGAPPPFIDQRSQNAGASTITINVTANGVIATRLEDLSDELEPLLIDGIGRAISERDVVLIEPESRQALELSSS